MVQVRGCSAGLTDLRSFNLRRVHSQRQGHQRIAGGRLGARTHTRPHAPLMPRYGADLPLANFGWGHRSRYKLTHTRAPSRRHSARAPPACFEPNHSGLSRSVLRISSRLYYSKFKRLSYILFFDLNIFTLPQIAGAPDLRSSVSYSYGGRLYGRGCRMAGVEAALRCSLG